MCGSCIPTLKSPKINIFLYFEECLRSYLILPDGSLSWFYEDYTNNLSNTFHSVGLAQQFEGLKKYFPYSGPEGSRCTSNIYRAYFLHIIESFLNISANFSKTCAHFSNITVSSHFSEVSMQLLKINTSLISISTHYSLIAEPF